MQWKFSAWADEFVALYFSAVDCPYAEVRGLISALLNAIDQLKVRLLRKGTRTRLTSNSSIRPIHPPKL